MGFSSLVLNIPLIILGYRFMGKHLLSYTIWGTIVFPSFYGYGAYSQLYH